MINYLKIRQYTLRSYCLSFLLLIISLSAKPQVNIDSLKNQLKQLPESEHAEVLNKISQCYVNTNIKQSYSYANKAFYNAIEFNNKIQEAKALLNIGVAHLKEDQIDISNQKVQQALKLFNAENNLRGVSDCMMRLGDLYYKKMNFDSAQYYYHKAINLKTDLDYFKDICNIYFHLALINKNNSNFDLAESCFKKIIDYKESDIYVKKDSYLKLSEIYEEESQGIEALHYYKIYARINDSIIKSTKVSSEIIKKDNLEINYSDRKILIVILYSGLGLIIVISGFLFYFYREKKLANSLLSEQNQKIKKQNIEIKKQAEDLIKYNDELKKLSIVASKTDNAIIIANTNGCIEWINESCTRLYGFTEDELIKKEANTYVETSSNPEVKEIFDRAIVTKETQIYEADVIARNGKNCRIQTTLTPVIAENGEVAYLIAIDSDVTKLKNTEKELQRLLITKDRFFSIIAHDLKNPFNNIMGISQLLVQGFERMKTEKVKYFHKGLLEISKNGYELLINLLEWARSQKGAIEFNPTQIDLHKLIEETFSLYRTRANQKEINLTNEVIDKTEVFADLNMLKTILRNLVSNALKFTDRGGAIEICSQFTEKQIQITVRDTGIGIEPKAANSLFKIDEYISTEGTDHESGTGLGLILCKEFIDKHNGSIWVESKVGFGSKFNFALPLRK